MRNRLKQHDTLANELYQAVRETPLLCPHGHVDPKLFSTEQYRFSNPTELLVTPDHYVFRMLYSQGIPLERLGIEGKSKQPIEQDPRKIWQTFGEHFYLFRATPTGSWIKDELSTVFGVEEKLGGKSAQAIYSHIDAQLQSADFTPRALYDRFNIECLCTTDPATYDLSDHKTIRESGWHGRILPTFRPDSVVKITSETWADEIGRLSDLSGVDIINFSTFLDALRGQREAFKQMGAVATDHDAETALTMELERETAEQIFQRALNGTASEQDAIQFTAHMFLQFARMSIDDGLVMQMHTGSFRNHNEPLYKQFGANMGADIPVQAEFSRNLRPLLNRYGNDGRFSLILFTLDETTYARELAPLAGHYPAVKLGPPWWFHDSWNGMQRYLNQVVETAGIYNTAGFNDDTRAFPSIPARHDLWRNAVCHWLSDLVYRKVIDEEDAAEMAYEMAYGLAKKAYNL